MNKALLLMSIVISILSVSVICIMREISQIYKAISGISEEQNSLKETINKILGKDND